MAGIFSTPRLHVRQFVMSDDTALHRVCGDRRTMRLVGDGRILDLGECRQWIRASMDHYAALGHGAWAVCARDEDLREKGKADETIDSAGVAVEPELIGYCGIVPARRRSDPELIYALLPRCWGRGLASELVPALVDHGFAARGLPRLVATVRPENVASVRVLERAGMHCAGEELAAEGIPHLVYALDKR